MDASFWFFHLAIKPVDILLIREWKVNGFIHYGQHEDVIHPHSQAYYEQIIILTITLEIHC